ncbi:NAD(P)H-dependent oxidoreductase [Streptacidiphilus fuscans]|uniref:NAD(P)H-dependent oxidoreductase n=1 Tax=Streptacidiphilus fuscans TaxID=2789292 RepID=A0A931AWF0_9ACTN|nr:NAD(P)H-dependent oxidoreductase [Streptacidiphilus fuscans]MBF9066730.1 NAD(P)H-dependent oxidoreductase [Streptacidiphilus fuscans]
MTTIGIILGSVRSGRRGGQVAQWVLERAGQRTDAAFELIDLKDFELPVLATPIPAMASRGVYDEERTQAFSAAVAACDGFVFVTSEHNLGMPGALKNALDHLYTEWNDKAAGFVSYGVNGGVRAVEQLKLVGAALQLAVVAAPVILPFADEFEDHAVFRPGEAALRSLDLMLDKVVSWTTAMSTLRSGPGAETEIRARIDAIVDGIHARDLDALRRIYATDVVSFDVEPPLQHVGVDAKLKNWARVFTLFDEVSYELRDLDVTVGGDLAVAHGFGRLSGRLANGSAVDGMWVRGTFCFRRVGGAWLIVHDQASVPFDVLTGRGVTDLEP